MTIDVFISYSQHDRRLQEQLVAHLAQLKNDRKIRTWHVGQISAGQQWEQEISSHLAQANVILLLISAQFLNSSQCYEKELAQAIARHETGQARVIPVILKPCDWQSAPFSKLQPLPKSAKPITSWPNRDAGWTDVVLGIRAAIHDLCGDFPKEPTSIGDKTISIQETSTMSSSEWVFEMTTAGELTPYAPPVEWGEEEDGLAYYARLGFNRGSAGSIGTEDLDHLTWYEGSGGRGHKYLVEWGDVLGFRLIFVPDWPTLIKLQALAAPIIQAANMEFRLGELQSMAEKAFRAWHQHDPTGICMRCDPDEMKRRQEMRAKRAHSNSDKGSQ